MNNLTKTAKYLDLHHAVRLEWTAYGKTMGKITRRNIAHCNTYGHPNGDRLIENEASTWWSAWSRAEHARPVPGGKIDSVWQPAKQSCWIKNSWQSSMLPAPVDFPVIIIDLMALSRWISSSVLMPRVAPAEKIPILYSNTFPSNQISIESL